MIRAGILGGTGYTGGELLRILRDHPSVKVEVVTSRKESGRRIDEYHTHLRGVYSLKFIDVDLKEFRECDVVFSALPHGSSMEYIPELLDMGIRVIDLSADYRLAKDVYEKTYGLKHKGYRRAVYGLPEIYRDLSFADLVANPGCYPTGAILSVAPLAKKRLIETVVFDSKSGVTGAGVTPTEFTHFPNIADNIVPYRVTNHRHFPEIEQELTKLGGKMRIAFTPHLIPVNRGILTTAHVYLKGPLDKKEIQEIYEEFYSDCYFIRFVDSPSVGRVRGSNFCDIGFFSDGERLVVISAIDNLVKGASGQAVQNMNLMFGIPEERGLTHLPVFP